MPVALDRIAASDLKPLVGEQFVFYFSEQESVNAVLEKVIELPAIANIERQPFSILFQTEQKDRKCQQGIYAIEHPGLGTLELFLVPVAYNEKGLQYEAVFS